MNKTILMLEDNINVMKLNKSVMKRQGFNVICAQNIRTARELIASNQIDLAVLDILLPDGNGLKFAREVKNRCGCPLCGFFVCSG